MRQESLGLPKNVDLLNLHKTVKVQQHPALFEEGNILNQGAKVKLEALQKLSYEIEDDGLKVLSAQDYIDIRSVYLSDSLTSSRVRAF